MKDKGLLAVTVQFVVEGAGGWRGDSRAKVFKGKYEAKKKFPEGVEVGAWAQTIKPFMEQEGVGIFSETTCTLSQSIPCRQLVSLTAVLHCTYACIQLFQERLSEKKSTKVNATRPKFSMKKYRSIELLHLLNTNEI